MYVVCYVINLDILQVYKQHIRQRVNRLSGQLIWNSDGAIECEKSTVVTSGYGLSTW